MQWNVKAFAITCCLAIGGALFALTIWMLLYNTGSLVGSMEDKTFLALFIPGYSVSILGAFIAGILGAGAGLVGGAVFAFVHNIVDRIFPSE